MSNAINPLVDPKEVTVTNKKGIPKKFIISEVPWGNGGRELCTQYIPTGTPRIGDYKANEELAMMMYSHIEAVVEGGENIRLVTRELVSNHLDCPSAMKLEGLMLEHNMGFSVPAKVSGFLEMMAGIIEESISKISMALAQHSSQPVRPQDTN